MIWEYELWWTRDIPHQTSYVYRFYEATPHKSGYVYSLYLTPLHMSVYLLSSLAAIPQYLYYVHWTRYIDGSVQDCSNSSALAMELL